MTSAALIASAQWLFLGYFAGLNLLYLGLNLVSLVAILRDRRLRIPGELSNLYSGLEPPISLLVPAYNEETTIVASIRSMLQLSYPQMEVIVINDGSCDGTLAVLEREFHLIPFPEVYRVQLPTKAVRGIYRSTVHKNLRVIDKENGGKADSINAGINNVRHPLFCVVDADSILQRDSLLQLVAPFMDDPSVVAAGGMVRIANGCKVSGGFLESVGLPRNPLALFQVIEYLRAFLFGRMGWAPLNAILIVSLPIRFVANEVFRC
jgi:cellulose synthase/poly-beta-1,6-N-acetylglucosamine synthase-like glycosyltransferase